MAITFETYHETRFFRTLDGLRCASIFAVTARHCGLAYWGGYGVTLFFAISGFLITTLLLRKRETYGTISLRNFYARRSLRIFPLYYAVLLLYCIMTWRYDRGTPKAHEFFYNLRYFFSYTSNWGVRPGAHFYQAWSLATEEQFYLFWPFAVSLSRRSTLPLLLITSTAAYVIAMRTLIGADLVNFGSIGNRAATSMSPAICFGCILGYALHIRTSFRAIRLLLGTIPGLLLTLAATAAALAVRGTPDWLIEFLAALIVGCAVVCPWQPWAVLLGNPLVSFFGTISYGMYLFNVIGIELVHRFLPSEGLIYLLCSFLCVGGIAAVSYFTYERAFLRLKARYTRQRSAAGRQSGMSLAVGTAPSCRS